ADQASETIAKARKSTSDFGSFRQRTAGRIRTRKTTLPTASAPASTKYPGQLIRLRQKSPANSVNSSSTANTEAPVPEAPRAAATRSRNGVDPDAGWEGLLTPEG